MKNTYVFSNNVKLLFLGVIFFFSFQTQSLFAQEGCNCPDPGITINGPALLSGLGLGTSLSNSCIAINGTLTIDVSSSILASNVKMGTDAEIIIQEGVTFSLINNEIEACDQMWSRIAPLCGSTLICTGNDKINDAKSAIKPERGAHLVVKNNIFDKNYRGIHIPFSIFPSAGCIGQGVILDEPLTGNTFQCTGDLLIPHEGEITYAGIDMSYANLRVGEFGYTGNSFLKLKNGILAGFFSILEVVSGNSFEKIQDTGVKVTNSINVLVESGNQFKDSRRAIDVTWTNTKISENNVFNNNQFAVRVTNNINKTIDIQNNDFQLVRVTGITIAESYSSPLTIIKNNSMILDGSQSGSGGLGVAHGINAFNSILLPQGNAQIIENPINNFNGNYGIQLDVCEDWRVINNNISMPGFSQLTGPIDGIEVFNSENNLIAGNIITAGESLSSRGMIIDNSSGNSIKCNTMTNNQWGFEISGISLMPEDITENVFNGGPDAENGFRIGNIDPNSIIGPQTRRNNKWNGLYSNNGARHIGSSSNAADSRFFVQSLSPPLMPSFQSSNSSWFSFQGGSSFNCNTIPPGGGDDDQFRMQFFEKIAEGELDIPESTPGQIWSSENFLFKELKANPDLLGESSSIDAFYAENNSGEKKEIFDITTAINQAFQIDSETSNTINNLQNALNNKSEAFAMTGEELLNTPEENWAPILDERTVISGEISTIRNQLSDLLTQTSLSIEASFADVLAQNNQMPVTTLQGQNFKDVYHVFLSAYNVEGGALNTEQEAIILNVANQCYNTGGPAVKMARNLYNNFAEMPIEFNGEYLCNSGNQRITAVTSQKQLGFSIFPNPASETVNFQLKEASIEAGKIELFNSLGEKVISEIVSKDHRLITLDISNLPIGIYFAKVKFEHSEIEGKFTITNK